MHMKAIMKVTLAEMRMSFHAVKQRIDKAKLYHKIQLAKQIRSNSKSTLSILSDDCFNHVTTYLLDQETINGPKPSEPHVITKVTIKKDDKPAKPDKTDWQKFKAYVEKHKNWTAYVSFIYPNSTYHIMYIDRYE